MLFKSHACIQSINQMEHKSLTFFQFLHYMCFKPLGVWKGIILLSDGESLSYFFTVSGGDMDDSSPYEPVAPNRHPDAFRLASISSGIAGLISTEYEGVYHTSGNMM